LAFFGLFGTLTGIVLVHTVFGMPVMTLLFRNYYASLPQELFKAARIDGGGFWRIFFQLMLPMSTPILIVAVILQVTNIWNDFILGLVFSCTVSVRYLPAAREHQAQDEVIPDVGHLQDHRDDQDWRGHRSINWKKMRQKPPPSIRAALNNSCGSDA